MRNVGVRDGGIIRLPDAGASVTPALEREQKWLPNAGASISLALDQRRRWEWSKIRRPDACAFAPWTLESASENGFVSLRPKYF